jgi:hypothetical protein
VKQNFYKRSNNYYSPPPLSLLYQLAEKILAMPYALVITFLVVFWALEICRRRRFCR